jgi:hypothetical protein
MSTLFHPPLSRLIDASDIPGDFQAFEDLVQDGADAILGKVLYRDLVTDVSSDGVERYYSLTILTRELKLPLFGSGMYLVFFHGATTGFSEFPIILDWRWEVYKYIKRLGDEGFSALPEAFVDILLELADIEDTNEFIGQIVRVFLNDGAGSYQDFVQELISRISALNTGGPEAQEVNNIVTQLGILLAEADDLLTGTNLFIPSDLYEGFEENDTLRDAVNSAMNSLEVLEQDLDIEFDIVGELVQAAMASAGDLDQKFERLARLFEAWFDGITKQDFYDLLVPDFTLSLSNINAGLQFPRDWLLPVVENPAGSGNWVEDPDPAKLAALVFTVGTLQVSSRRGFELEDQSNVSFQRAMIGRTGILVEFSGLKVDLSKVANIPEADADGRPEDFRGMYAESAIVSLPAAWFKDQDNTNAEIFGHRLLIGTGGLSGKLGLRGKGGDNTLWVRLGESSGFELGFRSFDISFRQNKVESSNIAGVLKIAKFVYPADHAQAGQPVQIGIAGHIHDDGDFNLTASAQPPFPIGWEDVFVYHVRSLELGQQDDDFYLGTSGKLEFQGFLKDTLKLDSVDIEKLRIYSDGSIEFDGGEIHLIEPVVLPLGPVDITVTAIHFGSHQKEVNGQTRKFHYFGFDGGISVDPLGIEVRGDGVKFYYCTDDLPNPPDPYLHIKTLHLDLTIPASSPAVILNGWITIPEPGTSPEYAGGIKIQIPPAKIAGGADMKLMPRYPAFIVDASIELPGPIPLGPVAIYGFRGLIGYRYVAQKEAVGLVSGVDSWYDYYKHPPRGIHVTKFLGPDRSSVTGTPFSLGAGASVGTASDNGTTLNVKAMVLISIPSLFMIDGRAAVLSARLGLENPKEPPFFAFIAVGDNSMEFGFGADFKLPTKSGDIVTLYAAMQAAFFFDDSSKWYVNFGTKEDPVTATVIRILTIKSYLMLSAKGIEAGARGDLSFKRNYSGIKVSAWAFVELGGKISFERPQFGAYMAAGVGADIDLKILSVYASFDVLFGVEGAKPFKIYGEFRLCVKIKICWFFTFKFCGDIQIAWEFNSTVDRTPVNPVLAGGATPIADLVKGVNMLSNETFELAHLGASFPTNLPAAVERAVIPLDTYIDFKAEKGLIPNAVASTIGGVTNPPRRYLDLVPPDKIVKGKELRQVKHQYSVKSVEIRSWNPSTDSWEDYYPWKALYPADPQLDSLKAGQFQKSDGQYSTIRLLATTPFSYTEQGMPGWYVPEKSGLTPGVLFCEAEALLPRCASFLEKPLGHRYYCPDGNGLFYSNQAAFLLLDQGLVGFAEVVDDTNSFGFASSLAIQNKHRLQIRLPVPSVQVTLRLSTTAPKVQINYFASIQDDEAMQVGYRHPDPAATDPATPHRVTIDAADLDQSVIYDRPDWLPVTRIEVDPITPNEAQIDVLQEQLAQTQYENNRIALGLVNGSQKDTAELEAKLERLRAEDCETTKRPATTQPPFANRYEEPDFRPKRAKTFAEGSRTFAYAVGSSKLGAAVIKTALDGTVVWCRHVDSDGPFEFQDIVQVSLNTDDVGPKQVGYVLNGFAKKHHVLLCIDPRGNQRWIRRVEFTQSEPKTFLLSAGNEGIYFIYHDKLSAIASYTPQLLMMSASGAVLQARGLDIEDPHKGFVITAAKSYASGLVVAGRLDGVREVIGRPEGPRRGFPRSIRASHTAIIVDVAHNLHVIAARRHERVMIHDLAVAPSGKFVASAYHLDLNRIVLLQRGLFPADVGCAVPETNQMGSTLSTGSDGFYLSAFNKQFGRVYRFDSKCDPQWTKALVRGDQKLAIHSLFYDHDAEALSFATSPEPLHGVSNSKLDTCLTEELKPPRMNRLRVRSVIEKIVEKNVGPKVTPSKSLFRQDLPLRAMICAPSGGSGCSTLIHEVCWLSLVDYQYNLLIPGQDAIEEDTQAAIAGITDYIQPIWRPDTSYAVRIELEDLVDDNAANAGVFAFAFGFSTAGPVGYFHTHPHADYADSGEVDQFPLTSLGQYIDYNRSYPRADGNLLSAKPLFYDSELTVIRLFFEKPWARHFFHSWAPYNGQPARAGRLKIVIKDPAEGTEIVNPPALDYDADDTTHVEIPQSIESWQDDEDPQVPPVYQQYQHLLDSQQCVLVGGKIIKPKSEYASVVPKHLKPRKCYTVLVNNLYDIDHDGDFDVVTEMREVHRFTFRTSRYRDFAEQVNSYLLTEGEGGELVTRPAVFNVRKDFSSAELLAALACIDGSSGTMADQLAAKYQHPFDRAMEGILALPPLNAAQTTEFNLIRNSADDDKIVAVLIRNPEPFNDPRMPIEEVRGTITVLDGESNAAPGHRTLFSKDYSQALVMTGGLEITGPWSVRFQYKIWDGSTYVVPGEPEYSSDLAGTVIVSELEFTEG